MPKFVGRVFVVSADCPRHRPHTDFHNASWNEEDGERPDGTADKSQAVWYFARVHERFEIALWFCNGSHCSASTAHQSRVKKIECDSVVHMVTRLPFSVLVLNGDIFHAGLALTDVNAVFTCASDTVKYHVNFFKKRYRPPDGTHYLPVLRPGLLKQSFSSVGSLDALMDAVCGEFCFVQEASNEAPAAWKRSDELKLRSISTLSQQADASFVLVGPHTVLRKVKTVKRVLKNYHGS